MEVLALRMSRPRSAAHLTKNIFSNLFRVAVLVMSCRRAFECSVVCVCVFGCFFGVSYAQRERGKGSGSLRGNKDAQGGEWVPVS